MKNSTYFFSVSLLVLLLGACQNDGVQQIQDGNGPNSSTVRNPVSADFPSDTNQLARIAYEEREFDFGTVEEGTLVTHTFKFTNVGKVPLTILKARSSCGCTVPEWPEEAIPPGGTGEILAKFNTDAKHHNQSKTITVTANTYPNESKVVLKGYVTPKDEGN